MPANELMPLPERVRILAASGCRDAAIRSYLNLSASAWRREKRKPSIKEALELGRAQLASEVVEVMIARMRNGSESAAKWLGEKVCGFNEPERQAPQVSVVLVNALSVKQYEERWKS